MTNKSLHILMLADAVFEDLPGGSRVVARELARGLVARGHQVTFLVAKHQEMSDECEMRQGVRIIRYTGAGSPITYLNKGRHAAKKLLKAHPVDIVHTHFAYSAMATLSVVQRSVPHIRSFYGPWDAEGWVEDRQNALGLRERVKAYVKRTLRRQIEAHNLRRSALTVVLSEHSRQEVRLFGYPESQIRLLPGGADTERFRPPGSTGEARETLGLPIDRPLLLSIRRLAPRMGLSNLIRAMAQVVETYPQALLLIGGKGAEKERLRMLINSLRLEENVQLIGFIPDEQLAGYYGAADLFVLPTLALEGFGLVTTESLACGTPVLGTPVGATPEILQKVDSRLVLSGYNPEDIAQGITQFLAEGSTWGLTPSRLHQFVQENYAWETHIDGMEDLYRQLITHKGHE